MEDENMNMEQTTMEAEQESSEETGGIPGELILGVIGVIGGGLLFLKKKFGGKKYAVVDHGRFGKTN